ICPRLHKQDFVKPPSEEELVTFIQELGYSGKLKESRAQILWGMYNKKNVDYVALLWEDFMYQADNREISSARKEHMPYPRFTKVIISHFISKDKTISMRKRINLHIIRDDSFLDVKDSKAYKTYYDFATGKATPNKARKFKKVASPSRKLSLVLEEEPAEKPKQAKKPAKKSTTVTTACVAIRDTPSESVPKKKTPAKVDRGKGMDLLFDVALLDVPKNSINLHTIRDDSLLGKLNFVSKTQDCQQYGALNLDDMINQDVKDSKAYKTYYDFATRKATPKKARKFKKVASPSRKLSPVLGEEPAKKPKRAKKPAKKSTTVPTAGVAIKDAPSKSVPKKKTPTKVDRGKGMDLLSNVALLEAAQIKKTLKKSKLETHKLHAIGSDDGVGSLPKFLDEQEDKTTGTDEGTGDSDDDDSDEVTKDDDEDDVESDVDDDREASDSEKTNSDKDENLNLNQNDDEGVYTEHKEQGKEDEEMTDAGRDDTQQTKYEQVKDDEHVRHEEPSTQTPPLLNIPVTVIPETLTDVGSTISPTIPPITPLQQQLAPTPTPVPTTAKTTTSVFALPDFSSLFGFDQRVFALEKEFS
ncbi:hypothetical protein Tco_1050032, partial [Tanacetum coccineum]